MADNYHLKLSICIVTYNHSEFIGAALDSVLTQNINVSHEIIVADDCSTDGTREIIKKYAEEHEQIKLILQPHNIGPTNNHKELITSAVGEYVAFMDGDDLMLPGKINYQVDFLDKNPDCNLSAHNLIIYDSSRKKEMGKFSKFKSGKYDIGTLARYGTFFGYSSKMFRNSANQGYPYYDSYKYIGDYPSHIYQTKESKIGYTSECFGVYRKHANNWSSLNGTMERIMLVYEENKRAILQARAFNVSEEDVDNGIMRITYSLALQYLKHGEYQLYRKYMKESTANHIYYSLKHRIFRKALVLPDMFLRFLAKL